jgi:hypothetical protein
VPSSAGDGRDGLVWSAAAAGFGFAVGLALVAAGLVLRSRRRSALVLPRQ